MSYNEHGLTETQHISTSDRVNVCPFFQITNHIPVVLHLRPQDNCLAKACCRKEDLRPWVCTYGNDGQSLRRCVSTIGHELSTATLDLDRENASIICCHCDELLLRVLVDHFGCACEPDAVQDIAILGDIDWSIGGALDSLSDIEAEQTSCAVGIVDYANLNVTCHDEMRTAHFKELNAHTV